MLEDVSREDVIQVIDRAVEELLDRGGVAAPPVDALALAKHQLGMTVRLDERPPGRGRRPAGSREIVLHPDAGEERRHWTAAHAIGERLKPAWLERFGAGPGQSRALAGESLANLFAYRLLVPGRWFADDAPACDYDVPELKRRYATAAHEVVAWRLLDLPEPCVITVVDNGHVSRRRSNAWPVRRRLEPPEEECQRYVHDYSRPRRVQADHWTVWGWPVHQADWKREILRSVVEPEA